MKYTLLGLGCLLIFFRLTEMSVTQQNTGQPTPQTLSATPVLVELFTSEGCSTCPPADSLLARLEDRQPIPGALIIAFEEHVDYWNHEGWTDPYSDAEWTLRQQDYAAALKSGAIYTPQMVVDGQSQFIGSGINEAAKAIGDGAQRAKTEISLTSAASGPKGPTSITIKIGKLVNPSEKDTVDVWLAVAESGLHSAVTAGENSGKNLHHASVLRSLRKIGAADRTQLVSYATTANVKFKGDWKRSNLRLVVFVQERKSRKILGAASIAVDS